MEPLATPLLTYLETYHSGWLPVERDTWFDYNIQETPLQIKLENTKGKETIFDLYNTNSEYVVYSIIVVVRVKDSTTSDVTVYSGTCENGWTFNIDHPSTETPDEVIWTFVKTGSAFSVQNQYSQKQSFDFKNHALEECNNWSQEYNTMQFRKIDTASISYRRIAFYELGEKLLR